MSVGTPQDAANPLFISAVWTMLVLGLVLLGRLVASAILERTLREALRRHPPSVPVLVEAIEQRQPWVDNLLGVMLIAIGAALALLALADAAVYRLERLGIATALAIGGTSLLFYALGRHAGRASLVRTWLRANVAAAPADGPSIDDDITWADAMLAVAAAAIALAFCAFSLASYWRSDPKIVLAGLLVSLGIGSYVLYRRRRMGPSPSTGDSKG